MLYDPRPQHDVDEAGLIFQCHEDDATGGAGPLAIDDQAGDANELTVPNLFQRIRTYCAPLAEPGAQQRDWMSTQGQAYSRIVSHDVFGFCRWSQLR